MWGSDWPASCVYVYKETGKPGNPWPELCVDWVSKGIYAMWINCPLTDLHPELLEVETQRLSVLPVFV